MLRVWNCGLPGSRALGLKARKKSLPTSRPVERNIGRTSSSVVPDRSCSRGSRACPCCRYFCTCSVAATMNETSGSRCLLSGVGTMFTVSRFLSTEKSVEGVQAAFADELLHVRGGHVTDVGDALLELLHAGFVDVHAVHLETGGASSTARAGPRSRDRSRQQRSCGRGGTSKGGGVTSLGAFRGFFIGRHANKGEERASINAPAGRTGGPQS